jgi:hypothetical protein
MDVFQELEREIPKEYVENFINDLNSMYSGVIYSDPAPIVSNKWFRKPTQKEAATIWDQCMFLSKASESMIESGLWEWALAYGNMTEKDDVFYVQWNSPTTKYSGTWSAFHKWFLCTLGQPIQ